MDSLESLIPINQQNVDRHQERNPGASIMASRKRKIYQITRTGPTYLTRVPFRLSHTSQNAQIANSFSEIWVEDKYQVDMVLC